MGELLDSTEAARFLHRPYRTLAYWRNKRIGPRFARVGRRVLYPRVELEAYIQANLVETFNNSTADRA